MFPCHSNIFYDFLSVVNNLIKSNKSTGAFFRLFILHLTPFYSALCYREKFNSRLGNFIVILTFSLCLSRSFLCCLMFLLMILWVFHTTIRIAYNTSRDNQTIFLPPSELLWIYRSKNIKEFYHQKWKKSHQHMMKKEKQFLSFFFFGSYFNDRKSR